MVILGYPNRQVSPFWTEVLKSGHFWDPQKGQIARNRCFWSISRLFRVGTPKSGILGFRTPDIGQNPGFWTPFLDPLFEHLFYSPWCLWIKKWSNRGPKRGRKRGQKGVIYGRDALILKNGQNGQKVTGFWQKWQILEQKMTVFSTFFVIKKVDKRDFPLFFVKYRNFSYFLVILEDMAESVCKRHYRFDHYPKYRYFQLCWNSRKTRKMVEKSAFFSCFFCVFSEISLHFFVHLTALFSVIFSDRHSLTTFVMLVNFGHFGRYDQLHPADLT